jgi:hypothetical protein
VISNQVIAVIHVLGCFFASEPLQQRSVNIRHERHSSGDRWMSILDVFAHDMHVRLANREWVDVIGFEVAKTVVDETVCGFVRAYGVEHVLDRRVFRKTPVVLGDRGRCHLFPVLFQATARDVN